MVWRGFLLTTDAEHRFSCPYQVSSGVSAGCLFIILFKTYRLSWFGVLLFFY